MARVSPVFSFLHRKKVERKYIKIQTCHVRLGESPFLYFQILFNILVLLFIMEYLDVRHSVMYILWQAYSNRATR